MMHPPRVETGPGTTEAPTFAQKISRAARSLRHRDFRILWFGTLGNSAIMWMDIIVRSWLVWEITGSYVALATVNIARLLPSMFLSIPAGVLVDRFNRRQVLIVAQSGIFVLYAVLALLAVSDLLALWNIYLVFALMGVTGAFTQPARQSIIPMVVPPRGDHQRRSDPTAGFQCHADLRDVRRWPTDGAQPGLRSCSACSPATAAFVVLTSVLLRIPEMGAAPSGSAFGAAVQGLAYIGRHTVLRVLLIITFLVMLFGLPFASLLPGLVDEVFGAGASTFGMLMAVSGIGSVFATVLIASVSFRRPGIVVLTGSLLFSATLMVFYFLPDLAVTPALIAAGVLLAVGGFASGIHMATSNAMMLTQADPAYHGRVMSMNMLNHGFMPLGAYPAAWMAGALGAASTISLMGVILFGAAILVALAHPSLFRIRIDSTGTAPTMGHGGPAGGPMRAPAGGSGERPSADGPRQSRMG